MSKTIWEYKVLKKDTTTSILNGGFGEKELNKLGQEGWELIWVERSNPLTVSVLFASTSKIHVERTFYFKRKKRMNY